MPDPVLRRSRGHVISSEHVVLDGFEDMSSFHQRDVFIGGSVDRPPKASTGAEDLVQAGAILNASNLGKKKAFAERLGAFRGRFRTTRGFQQFQIPRCQRG